MQILERGTIRLSAAAEVADFQTIRAAHTAHTAQRQHMHSDTAQGEPIPRTHVPACMSHVCLCVCVCDGHWTVRGECGRWTGRAPSSCGLSPCRTEGRREPKLG